MIKILPVQNAAPGASSNQVSAQVQMVMQDASSHSVDVAQSYIFPVCIAVTGSPLPNTVLGSAIGISSGTSQQVTMPSATNPYTIATCFQSGFNLSFAQTDHEVLLADAGCALTYAGQSGQISASANLWSDQGNQAQNPTVDAGYIVSSYPTPGMGVAEVKGQSGNPIKIPFTKLNLNSVSSAAVVIRSWNVQYQSVHYVNTIDIGPGNYSAIAGTDVTVPGLSAVMNDNSGNIQDNNSSYCDALVIAVP